MTGHTLRWVAGFSLVLAVFVGSYGLFGAPTHASAQTSTSSTADTQAKLQAEYDALQAEIAQWQTVLNTTKAQKSSLQGDVTTLNAEIAQAQAQVKQLGITIANLGDQITQKTQTLTSLQDQLTQGQESLAKLIREQNETETEPLIFLALSSQGLSDFLSDIDDIDSINGQLEVLFDQLRSTEASTTAARDALNTQQNAQLDAEHEAEQKQAAIASDQAQKKQLLAVTTQNEATYTQVLADRQAQAEAIRTALFNLRDTQGISFETALTYANTASKATGVRPAMILAILSQESDLGANIGSCYVKDLNTGDGVGKNTGTAFQKVMKSPRDTTPFEQIAQTFGLDWSTTPVSCPLSPTYTSSRGYGGAMGPSQFIPSTWVLFEPRLEAALGLPNADPWDPQTAIMATALYLEDLGAAGQTYTSERNAACKYYSGRSCDSKSPPNVSYGNSVVAKADQFQQNIDCLNDNTTCSL